MTTDDIRQKYGEAWDWLVLNAEKRNRLLHRLHVNAWMAMDVTLATGFVVTFDLVEARAILAELEALTQNISAGMASLNEYGAKLGKSPIEWRQIDPRDV